MSFPSSHHTSGGSSAGSSATGPLSFGTSTSAPSRPGGLPGARVGANGLPRASSCHASPAEGDHQLEKLEFALAIALTRGDAQRSRQLREEIDRLGGNREEPGT